MGACLSTGDPKGTGKDGVSVTKQKSAKAPASKRSVGDSSGGTAEEDLKQKAKPKQRPESEREQAQGHAAHQDGGGSQRGAEARPSNGAGSTPPRSQPRPGPAATATGNTEPERKEDSASGKGGEVPSHPSNAPPPARRLKYRELQVATDNFDEAFLLGQGSFGKVYKGLLDEAILLGEGTGDEAKDPVDGGPKTAQLKLAIKKLNPESFQGYEEWLAEVLLLDKLRHPNLVRLVGYCAERGEALLAYELCPFGSLDQALFEGLQDGSILSWEQRVRVARDAALGLAYLHENNVIHRDFKPSNILLAEDMSGRLTDFGMARAGPDGGETHISTRVMGTMGYLDPTYMETGRLTRKSDTYAFGVMLLELLTGRRSMGESGGESLTAWVRPLLTQRRPDLSKLVDPRLEGKYSPQGAVKMAILAKHCIHEDPGHRPEMNTLAENLQLVDVKDS